VFCDESYIVFSSKIDKDNFRKNHNKKNHVGKHCNNPQCFVRKAIVLSPYDLALLYKDNFGKNHNKKQKKNQWEKYCSNLQCFKEKNYKVKFSTISILKK